MWGGVVPRGILSHLQLHSVDEFAAFITLVPPGLLIAAEGAGALHKAVGQEPLAVLTLQLLHSVLQQETTGQQALEDVLSNPRTGEKEQGGNPLSAREPWRAIKHPQPGMLGLPPTFPSTSPSI